MKKLFILISVAFSCNLCYAQVAQTDLWQKPGMADQQGPIPEYVGPGNLKSSVGKIKVGETRRVTFAAKEDRNPQRVQLRSPSFGANDILQYTIPEGSGIKSISGGPGGFTAMYEAGKVGKIDDVIAVSVKRVGTIYLYLSGEVVQ